MTNSALELSVVVCTRDRAGALRRALECYAQIRSVVGWELVIVDNGSSDDTAEVLREYLATCEGRVSVVTEPSKGLCRARNSGWRTAHGRIIAFTDDDCYPNADYIEMLRECFSEERLGFVGGRVLLFDPDDYPITIQTLEERVEIPPESFVESGLIHGANLAARRSVLEALGGFDELLGAGTSCPAGDDTDFVNRASAAGFAGAYDPRPLVFHHHRRRTATEVGALIRAYNIGRGAHYMKSVLDPTRRSQASRQWYWRTLLPAFRSRRAAQKLFHEMIGAIRYLVERVRS